MRKYAALIPLKIAEICNTFPEQAFSVILYEMFRAKFPGKTCVMKSEILDIDNEDMYKLLCRVQQQLASDMEDVIVE